MRNIVLTATILLASAQSGFALTRHLHGILTIVDDNNQPFPVKPVPGLLQVDFFSLRANNSRIPCGLTFVSNNTLEIVACDLPEQCGPDNPLVAELTGQPDGWKQDSEHKEIHNCQNDCAFELIVVRPRNPSPPTRRANYERGIQELSANNDDSTAFYLHEASLGNLAFAAKSANVLEAHGKQELAYNVLSAVDPDALNVSDKTQFQVLMRKANAARAAKAVPEAIAVYADATEIFPMNRQALSLAFATLTDAAGSSDTTEINSYLQRNPTAGSAVIKLCGKSALCNNSASVRNGSAHNGDYVAAIEAMRRYLVTLK